MTSGRRSALVAPGLDLASLAVFVVAGRESHDLGGGARWFFGVLWPLVAGWFVVALLAQLYTRPSRFALRVALTIAAGVGLGLVLRAVVSHRATPLAFVLVAYAFITAMTGGWRLVALGLRQVVRRRQPAVGPAPPS